METVGEGSCRVEVFDREGRKVAESAGTEGVLSIEKVRLWQPLNAYLYDIRVTFGEDVYTLPYGVRTVRVEGNKKGLFTRDRKPKLAAHYFRRRWHEIPDFDYKQSE